MNLNQYIILIGLIFILTNVNCQDDYLINPSFDAEPAINAVADGWEKCNDRDNTPDLYGGIGPSFSEVNLSPTDGNTFVLLRVREDSTYEDIQTKLIKPLRKDECYALAIDLAFDETVSWNLFPSKLSVYGGMNSCKRDQKLFETEPITNENWKNNIYEFIPEDNYEYLSLVPEWVGDELYYGAILIDNLHMYNNLDNSSFSILDTIVDLGSNVLLKASESLEYDWYPKTGLSCYDCQTPTAIITDSITYTVKIKKDSNIQCNYWSEKFKIGYYCETDSFFLPIIKLDTILSPDQPIFLSASYSVRYRWYPKIGLNCDDCRTPIAQVNQKTEYFASLLKPEGCYTVEKFTLRSVCDSQYSEPIKTLDTVLAKGSDIYLKADSSSSYLWTPPDYLLCDYCPETKLDVQKSQTYIVTLVDSIGCLYKQSFHVGVVNCDTIVPDEYFIALDTIIKPNEEYVLNPSGGKNFYWIPVPGLNCYECKNPIVKITDDQIFVVKITDNYGCNWEERFNINISDADSSRINVPNVITPNNDGFNDELEIVTLYEDISLKIFDSQGRLKFSQDNYDNTWNGIDNKGNKLMEGTYYYIVQIRGFDQIFSGYIYIKRE